MKFISTNEIFGFGTSFGEVLFEFGIVNGTSDFSCRCE